MLGTEARWGVFRRRGLLHRKRVRARPVGDSDFAVTQTETTKLRMPEGECTCVRQTVVPREDFLNQYVPVDEVAEQMV